MTRIQNRYDAVRCDGRQHLLTQIVHFYQSNAGRIVHTTHDPGGVTRWQLRDNCGYALLTEESPENGVAKPTGRLILHVEFSYFCSISC